MYSSQYMDQNDMVGISQSSAMSRENCKYIGIDQTYVQRQYLYQSNLFVFIIHLSI